MPRILGGNILEQRPFSRELVACDPTSLTTLAIGIKAGQGLLLLGTLMTLDGERVLLPWHAVGVLSHSINTDAAVWEDGGAATVYTKGRFLWKAVTEANRDVVFDELSIAGLKARGIDFEAVFSGASERWISLPH